MLPMAIRTVKYRAALLFFNQTEFCVPHFQENSLCQKKQQTRH